LAKSTKGIYLHNVFYTESYQLSVRQL